MPSTPKNTPRTRDAAMREDYTESMFQEGHNRTETDQRVHNAKDYDRAAHRGEANVIGEAANDDMSLEPHEAANPAMPTPQDTFHSRDGTDASGLYDEQGGPIGGTTEELDALEASGTPVDKNPRMKN